MTDFQLEYRVLPIERLKPNPANPNVMSQPVFEMLKENIAKEFKDPVIVRNDGGEGWLIEDGHHRVKALQELGYKEAPCIIVSGEGELNLSALMLNKIKGRLDSSKVGALLMGLRESYSSRDLVNITGYSSQDLENYASILKLPELPELAKYTNLSFFPYPRGKYHIRNKIIAIIPPHKCFIEVFGGAGHVILNKPVSGVLDVYNDLDGRLVNLFEVVRNRFPEFKEKCNGLLYSRELRNKFIDEPVPADPIEWAIRTYYMIRTSFSGMADSKGSFAFTRNKNITSRLWGSIEALEEIWRRLQSIIIENRDFRDCIRLYDSPETVFFLDPPYYGINYYKERFSEKDHEDLYKMLCGAVVGKWILTYNNHPWVREKYKGQEFRLASSPLSMSREDGERSRQTYSNLVIMNFKPEDREVIEVESSSEL